MSASKIFFVVFFCTVPIALPTETKGLPRMMNQAYFECGAKGNFSNPSDVTCKSYFTCNELISGRYEKSLNFCPEKRYFDPEDKICSVNYQCQVDKFNLKEISTWNVWEYNLLRDRDSFECTSDGKYENAQDSTCKTYYVCKRSILTGKFLKAKYKCPPFLLFNSDSKCCTLFYKCPHSQTTTEIIPITTVESCEYEPDPDYFECIDKGWYANKNDLTCRTYFKCEQNKTAAFNKILATCPENTYFDQSIVSCTTAYQCPCSSFQPSTSSIIPTSSGDTCLIEEDPDYFECTAKGKYPNLNDPTCQTYISCTKQFLTGKYIKKIERCLFNKHFDPSLKSCSKYYKCPCSQTTVTTKIAPITTAESCEYEPNPDYFECPSKGKFPNYNDVTCRSYFHCTKNIFTGALVKTKHTCLPFSHFNPNSRICSLFYRCPCSHHSTSPPDITTSTQFTTETTLLTTTTSEICQIESNPDYLTCTVKGRFPNKNDPSCETYFLCSQKGTGEFVKTKYSCPTNSVFDPSFGACSSEYQCPCDQEISTTESPLSTRTVSTTTAEVCIVESDPEYFTCTVKGRFPNKNDPSCETYFLCSQKGTGEFVKTKYSCPTDSVFDPSFGACSSDYQCPCDQEISTTESSVSTTTVSTTTAEVCIVESDPEYFTCTVKGRFPNKNDPSCETYFLCSLKGTGQFVKTKYSCPTDSVFDPSFGACSSEYQCPCDQEISTTESPVSTTTVSTTTAEDCTVESDPEYFTCTVKGRFPNKNDPSCETYFLCSQKGTGEFVKTKYSCPTNSVFDPSFGACSSEYQCPCDQEISTTESSVSTTTVSTTTAEVCIVESDPEYFTCTVKGRFPNKNDPSCETYFLCSQKGTGEFVKTKYSCPTNSVFDPSFGACSSEYQCPCDQEISTTESPVSTTTVSTTTAEVCIVESDPEYFTCTVKGRFPNKNDPSCETYFLCSLKGTGQFVKTKYSCPTDSVFDPSFGACSSEYQCPCDQEISTTESPVSTTTVSTTTAEDCTVESDPEYFTCTVKGRFPNKNDPSCETYFLCSQKGTGEFVKTKYSCPTNSVFDPSFGECSSEYQCPCDQEISTTESPVSTTTVSTTTAEVCIVESDPEYFTCTVKGRFPNKNDPSCETYFLCSQKGTGEFVKTKYSCLTDSVFDPSFGACSSEYQCPCDQEISTTESPVSTTTVSTTTAEDCTVESDPEYFTCTVKGRFPNKNDPSCETYFLCSQKGTGEFVKTKYSCPTNSVFDPSFGACSSEYQCPCDQEISTTESPVSTTTVSTTTAEVCIVESDPEYFTCTVKGRFPNKNDPSCETYFLCSLKGTGQFVKTKYSCPTDSVFDPSFGACSSEYQCPCDQEISTTESPVSTTTVSTTTAEDCTVESDPEYFTCTVKGRFPNKNDPSCETYFLCSQKGTGEFVKTKYSCPTNSVFDPSFGECSSEYQCPCDQEISTTESPVSTTTVSTTTAEVCIVESDPEYFTCTVKGRFPNKNDPSCETYFLCSQKGTGEFVKTKYSCLTDSVFDPSFGACSSEYQCPCDQEISTTESPVSTTTVSTTTAEDCTVESDPEYFTCTVKGRFPNKNDPSCETYFLCSQKGTGEFVKTKYTCPTNSLFDSNLGACSLEFECPCETATRTLISKNDNFIEIVHDTAFYFETDKEKNTLL